MKSDKKILIYTILVCIMLCLNQGCLFNKEKDKIKTIENFGVKFDIDHGYSENDDILILNIEAYQSLDYIYPSRYNIFHIEKIMYMDKSVDFYQDTIKMTTGDGRSIDDKNFIAITISNLEESYVTSNKITLIFNQITSEDGMMHWQGNIEYIYTLDELNENKYEDYRNCYIIRYNSEVNNYIVGTIHHGELVASSYGDYGHYIQSINIDLTKGKLLPPPDGKIFLIEGYIWMSIKYQKEKKYIIDVEAEIYGDKMSIYGIEDGLVTYIMYNGQLFKYVSLDDYRTYFQIGDTIYMISKVESVNPRIIAEISKMEGFLLHLYYRNQYRNGVFYYIYNEFNEIEKIYFIDFGECSGNFVIEESEFQNPVFTISLSDWNKYNLQDTYTLQGIRVYEVNGITLTKILEVPITLGTVYHYISNEEIEEYLVREAINHQYISDFTDYECEKLYIDIYLDGMKFIIKILEKEYQLK